MKNKDMKQPEVIRLPELEIHGVWKKVIDRLSHIRRLYWISSISVFLVLLIIFTPYTVWEYLWTGLIAQRTIVIMLLVFNLVAVSLVWSAGQRMDVWVLMYFNMYGRRAPWLDWIMIAFTQIGSGIFTVVIAFIAFLTVSHLKAYELALGALTLWLLVELLKVIFHRARPYVKIITVRIVGSRAGGKSFPSGHTSQSFFLATSAVHIFQLNVYIALVLYGIALLVGITRIYVGMHYPRDVVGGAILGASWGLIAVIINSYIFRTG